MRIVLVVKDARGDVGNQRGGVLLKDIEHVASMFQCPDQLASVGLILTSAPITLRVPGVAAEIVQNMHSTFKKLLGKAVAADEYMDLSRSIAICWPVLLFWGGDAP